MGTCVRRSFLHASPRVSRSCSDSMTEASVRIRDCVGGECEKVKGGSSEPRAHREGIIRSLEIGLYRKAKTPIVRCGPISRVCDMKY